MTSNKDKEELLQLLQAMEHNLKYRKLYTWYFQDHFIEPINGCDISRDKYKKHLAFMQAGAKYRERAVIAPNRAGKTEMMAVEVTYHLTKDYPTWWEGKRFKGSINVLCVGKTNQSIRDVLQEKLLGMQLEPGTGILPYAEHNNGVGVIKTTTKPNTAGATLDIFVRDKNGDINHLLFLSQEMDFGVIMGRALHFIWFDEECLNQLFYEEAMQRTVTTNGIVVHTFTPLDGMTPTIMTFCPDRHPREDGVVMDSEGNIQKNRYCINLSLVDTPHLTPEMIEYQFSINPEGPIRDARCYGIPSIGSGQIFPFTSDQITCAPFQIPQHWPVAFGIDFGWTETAVVWMAMDPNSKTQYIYAEYFKGHALPLEHVMAIRARSGWSIPGLADPAGMQSNAMTGKEFVTEYSNLLGKDLTLGNNAIAASIARLQLKFTCNQLKLFSTCTHIMKEISLWRYDDKGQPAKNQDDHCIDALRYVESKFEDVAETELENMKKEAGIDEYREYQQDTRSKWTGY